MDNKEEMKLEQIVQLMEEGKPLSDEQLLQLSQDKEAMRLCRELQHCKNAVIRRFDDDSPDVAEEWRKFAKDKAEFRMQNAKPESVSIPLPPPENPRRQHRFLWGMLAGVAASFIAAVLYIQIAGLSLSSPGVLVFQAIDSVKQVTLQTSAGKQIALTRETREEAVEVAGTAFHKKDTLELSYAEAKTQEVPTEEIQMHLLSTPRGKDFKITLEDGTTVWLNAESSLKYPSRFTGKNRMVYLTGEAYFKVTKNPDCPFIICTDQIQAQVLGTELNVQNYSSKNTHVTLINGRVNVTDSKNEGNAVSLKPGEDAQWQETNSFIVKNVDTDAYVYRKDGYFYFNDLPLVDIMQELGRWYNINVIFENQELMDMRIRYFCVRSETLERAISLLNHMKKIQASVSGNTVYIR